MLAKSRIRPRTKRNTREIRRLLFERPVCATCLLGSRESVRTRYRETWELVIPRASKTPTAEGFPAPRSRNLQFRWGPPSGLWVWSQMSAGLWWCNKTWLTYYNTFTHNIIYSFNIIIYLYHTSYYYYYILYCSNTQSLQFTIQNNQTKHIKRYNKLCA